MRNDFTEETKNKFKGIVMCWFCERMKNEHGHLPDAFHHILGRCSRSAFNLAPIHNSACHIGNEHKLGRKVDQLRMLTLTARHLNRIDHELKERDEEFINNHQDLFDKVNQLL